jgi:hypothetical protein
MSQIVNSIITVILIIIIFICFLVASKIKEGFTCSSSQISVLDMKILDYNCISSLTSGIPTCETGQQIITNAPNSVYRCATVYGDPTQNQCNINTNNLNNYIITCDGYDSSGSPTYIHNDIPLPPPLDYNYNNIMIPPIIDACGNIVPPVYYNSPLVYPTFASPQCNIISKLIIKTDSNNASSSSSSSTYNDPNNTTNNTNNNLDQSTAINQILPNTSIPTTRMSDSNKAISGIKPTYVYESIPFPYLPAFKSF